MKRRRPGIPENRVDLEIEIQDSDRQLAMANALKCPYVCGVCNSLFIHARVPHALVKDLKCPECKEKD